MTETFVLESHHDRLLYDKKMNVIRPQVLIL